MKGLADAKWTEVLTAAVTCAGAGVAWLTFWMSHREKLDTERQQRREKLDRQRGAVDAIRGAVEAIGPWAATEYTDRSHDPAWYNASWTVFPLPLDGERLRELIESGEFPEGLSAAAVRLEAAARRFHEFLERQGEYLRRAPQDIGLHWPAVVAAAQAKGAELTGEELGRVQGLSDENRAWLSQLYRRNKEIHVKGIGGPGGDGLHESLRLAAAEIEPARQGLGAAVRALDAPGRAPSLVRWGHGLAGAFVVAGVILLGAFYASAASKTARWLVHRVCPCAPVAPPSAPSAPFSAPAAPPRDSSAAKAQQPSIRS